jgi:hypothetical protein
LIPQQFWCELRHTTPKIAGVNLKEPERTWPEKFYTLLSDGKSVLRVDRGTLWLSTELAARRGIGAIRRKDMCYDVNGKSSRVSDRVLGMFLETPIDRLFSRIG